jgi:hypothetical protein
MYVVMKEISLILAKSPELPAPKLFENFALLSQAAEARRWAAPRLGPSICGLLFG